jgi:uncharacterized protein (TIGR00251 family)
LPPISSDLLLSIAANGVRVAIRLTPRGRGDRVEGIVRGADGATALQVSVTAPPAEGRANDALLRLLAKRWGVARRDLAIVAGLKSRNKLVHVAGDPEALLGKLRAALVALPGS